MATVLLWGLLWLWCAFGVHSALFLVDWRNNYFLRSLPRPDGPNSIGINRVVASLLIAAIAFAVWPLFFWMRLRRLGQEDDHDANQHERHL